MLSDALSALSGFGGVLLVILGFGALIFVHELGHFLAARWAGVRAHEFAIGFGPAICAYRKGLGFRMGSTHGEYASMLQKTHGVVRPQDDVPGVSATEYRLNLIPFGGYVKMLGQEDGNPGAMSSASDSYTEKPIWKRMVIMSGGVIMNIITAAILFVIVFMVGLQQPAPIIGDVDPELPAAVAANASGGAPGLMTGDRVLSINGKPTPTFNYVGVAAAMARPSRPLEVVVQRPGVEGPLTFTVKPTKESGRGVVMGVDAGVSGTVGAFARNSRDAARQFLNTAGLRDVWTGATIVEVNGQPADSYYDLDDAVRASGGAPVTVIFETPEGERLERAVQPVPQMQASERTISENDKPTVLHLLGLTPPMGIAAVQSTSARQAGLREGDLLSRIGTIEWPDTTSGVREIQRNKGGDVALTVVRDGEYTSIEAPVNGAGQVGFGVMSAAEAPAIATRTAPATNAEGKEIPPHPASELDLAPGTRILTVEGAPVETYTDLRRELRHATETAHAAGEGASVTLRVRLPLGERYGDGPEETLPWSIPAESVAALHALGWTNPVPAEVFRMQLTELKAGGPIGALKMGVVETHRIVTLTYLTLLRLVQGSVEITQLRGPVGITHIGSQVVQDGVINLLFFLAVISVNLAVLNFLPLPIVDGGHMVFLAIEGITGKPVSIAVQNLAALLGLALVGGLFLLITFNDIKNLLNAL